MITTWGKREDKYAEHVAEFFSKIKKIPLSKLTFFTLKSNKNQYKMDKVRKWVSKFASKYILVQSPKGGIHYHGLYFAQKNPGQLNKGTHFLHHVVGENKGDVKAPFEAPTAPPRIKHPKVSGNMGYILMELCKEIRGYNQEEDYRHPDDNIVSRVKGRASRRKRDVKINFHLDCIKEYLRKNFNENENPTYYDNLIIKM